MIRVNRWTVAALAATIFETPGAGDNITIKIKKLSFEIESVATGKS